MNNEEKIVSASYIKKKTIIAFGMFIFFIGISIFSWNKLMHQPKEEKAIPTLRRGLELNEFIFSTLFSKNHLTKEYAKNLAAPKVRVNGDAGLAKASDTANWKLQVVRKIGDTINITLEEIKALPKTEITFDFKCIEGWSQITNWGGVRFSDFMVKYGLANNATMKYVGMQTPDGLYYVGIDMPSMLQEQTILCYEMNGKPLPMKQGYPLRLIIPVKYGVKHLKRIGTIFFDNNKPRDYWYEQGYDYYCGL